jgi:hypothetical protein
MNFLFGLMLVAGGTLALIYHRSVFNFTGQIGFVEQRIPGSSSSFIKLMSVLAVILGLLFATGLGGWLTQPITDGLQNTFGGINT